MRNRRVTDGIVEYGTKGEDVAKGEKENRGVSVGWELGRFFGWITAFLMDMEEGERRYSSKEDGLEKDEERASVLTLWGRRRMGEGD